MATDIPPPTPPKNWAMAEFEAYKAAYLGEDTLAVKKRAAFDLAAWIKGDGWNFLLNSISWAVEQFNAAVVAFTPVTGRLAAQTIHDITGIKISVDRMGAVLGGVAGRAEAVEIGAAFHPVLDNMFPIGRTASLTTDRSTRAWALDNVNAYFGTNLLFQLRSLTIATIASFVPEFQLRHLEGLHQTINWAFGFGWLSWSVMSAIMDVTTTKPLKEHYNRLIKPEDLTVGAANKALLAGLLPAGTWGQILDNDGVRDDIRQIELDLAEKDLSDSKLRTLWEEDMVDEAYLTQAFRLQGYGLERATKAVQLLTLERQIALRDKSVTIHYQLYRDCVIEEQEFRQILIEAHYNVDEANQMVANAIAERRIRTFLPTTDMFKAVKKGLLDVSDAVTALQCRGYTYDDATVEALLRLEDKLPPCEDVKLEEKAMVSLLQGLGSNLGVNGRFLRPNVIKYLQCLDLQYFLVPPVVTLSVTPDRLPAPGNVTLTWRAILATSAKIEPTIGPVPLEGSTTLHIAHSTGFTIHGHSPIGDSYAYAFVDVTPK